MNLVSPGSRTRLPGVGRRLAPAGLSELLVRLGPTFVKIGQYLALRPDLIGQEYCDEFSRLSDEAPTGPFQDAQQILAEDLGDAPEPFFAWLNPRPIGAASLAEVYQARTKSGEEVVIKIQRKNIAGRVQRDLARVRLIGRILAYSGLVAGVSVREVVDELRTWMLDELDYRHELGNLTRLYRLAERSSGMRIPRPYPELCGQRVLTMEYLRGVPFTELLRLTRAGVPERIAQLELDRDRVAESLFAAVLEQIFAFDLFHADTHPGNLLALPHNQIGFVDFGLVDSLDPSTRDHLMEIVRGAYAGDGARMLRGLLAVLIAGPDADVQGFRDDFLAEARTWQRARLHITSGAAEHTAPNSRFMVRALRAARQRGLRLPPNLLAVYRSLLTAETVAHQVSGTADLGGVARRFFARLGADRLRRSLEPDQIEARLIETVELLRTGPGRLERLLGELTDDRFVLRVESSDTRQDQQRADRRAELVALAVVSVGLALLEVAAQQQVLFDSIPLRPIVLAILLVVYGRFVILWIRLR